MSGQEKIYPMSYPHDVLRIINAMSFNKGRDVRIMGSMALRSQAYAADYDCFEVVKKTENSVEESQRKLVKEFQGIVRAVKKVPNCFITDIKAGSVEEWRVIPEKASIKGNKIVHLDINACRNKIVELENTGILTRAQADSYLEKLNYNMTPEQFVIIKKDIRPNIVRWTADDIERGYKNLKGGKQFTLEEAFTSPVITKLDLIGWVQGNRFAEFSMIYKFYHKGKPLNLHNDDVEQALKENILYYSLENNWFKVAKRMFSYSRFHDDEQMLRKITPLLNSDIGRLYVILSDIKTILMMLEQKANVSKSKIFFELDQIRGRFANIYTVKRFFHLEFQLLKLLESALSETNDNILENVALVQDLDNMANIISNIINESSGEEMKKLGLLPLPKRFQL